MIPEGRVLGFWFFVFTWPAACFSLCRMSSWAGGIVAGDEKRRASGLECGGGNTRGVGRVLRLQWKESKSKKGGQIKERHKHCEATLETGSGERRRCGVEIAGESRLEW